MDQNSIPMDSEVLYPILFIPKKCTRLESTCEASDNVYIDLKITSPDTEGNETSIYSGFCNIKLIDTYDVSIQQEKSPSHNKSIGLYDDIPVIIADTSAQPSYSQSEVWIDPSRSPFVYNHYDASQTQEMPHYSVCQETHTSRITFEQHNTYITKNVYNYKEAIHYSSPDNFDCKKFKKIEKDAVQNSDANIYEEDEFECGVFLSQLPKEIMNEKENRDREERKYIGLKSENGALKQLMSSDIQSVSKQRKTILFLGQDSHHGQTIQKIAYNDPYLECPGGVEVDNEVVIDNTEQNPHVKKYQCAKCQQIFDHIADLRDHMVNHSSPRTRLTSARSTSRSEDVKYMCLECGKNLKSREKFEMHCLGHGDPDLECNKCHKVFASKFTLRVHNKIHNRKYPCSFCSRTYAREAGLRAHVTKAHDLFPCASCDYSTSKYSELAAHELVHREFYQQYRDSSETDLAESFLEEVLTDSDMLTPSPECVDWRLEEPEQKLADCEEIRKADSIIAKVMSNKMFLSKKAKRNRRYNKVCDVCLKTFDRVSDLKRHLIEHVVRSTLAKTPVNKNGTLTIQCEVCQLETFTKIDKYKAHLRDHAKLTLYQCTFCNKSFSDSSNFSKHKKIHGATYFQCDLCQRKFNSKKMITQHMEYHNKHPPLQCRYCDKYFHFESMLNKHIKGAHTRELSSRFRCRFCHDYFKTLKEKWDHEWKVHSVRKMIVDCLICGAKFRKYAELKRHCVKQHDIEIPPAKKLLKRKSHKSSWSFD